MKQTVDLTIIESQALGAGFNTPAISVAPYQLVSLQIIFTFSGGASSAGSVSLQSSNDGINFSTVPSSTLAYTNTTTNHIIELQRVGFKFLRLNNAHTSGTGGTCKVIAHCTIGV
jgi:hypothetical protein